jgi:hypothetical protein
MILESRLSQKRFFNPKSKEDMKLVKYFFKNHSWGKQACPFFLEFPYSSIPDMLKDKIIHETFGISFDRFHHVWGD